VALVTLAGCTSGPAPDPSSTVDRSVVGYVDQVDPDEQPIAEFVAHYPGVTNTPGWVKVQVLSLEVTGDVMALRLALTPLSDDGKSPSNQVVNLADVMYGTFPTLSDVEHMVEYKELRTQYPYLHRWGVDGVDNVWPRIQPGGSLLFWTYFDAPDERVDQLDLVFSAGWPVIEDVPVVWS